ncbi:MAG: alpha-L-fucosidase [Anaerolineaceae bacterium]|nr:alpha-L-fucosidase [Anaerolineaceae bacterium]
MTKPTITPNMPLEQNRGQRAGSTKDARMQWFREARFGLFIHWGLYSIPAGVWKDRNLDGEGDMQIGEWIMRHMRIPVAEYEQLAKQFSPVKFDAKAWVALAKTAGQKYITITAKHHDGFCMFKSDYTDYNIVDSTPFGRDVCKELADECAKEGLRMCFYYSQTQDWHHPGGLGNDWDYTFSQEAFDDYIESYVKPQVTELLTNYGPIGLIWFDTPYDMPLHHSESLMNLVHELQPDCLVSGRIGNNQGDYASAGDNKVPDDIMKNGDFETPATINDTWGYKSLDHNWKSTKSLIHHLVDIVSKNGNYLLNIGPDAEGGIPQPSVERLLAMGEWLKVNGESIYGCGAGPIQEVGDLRSTRKKNVLFLHVINLPEDGEIRIKLDEAVACANLLIYRRVVLMMRNDGSLILQLPDDGLDKIDTVVKLVLK